MPLAVPTYIHKGVCASAMIRRQCQRVRCTLYDTSIGTLWPQQRQACEVRVRAQRRRHVRIRRRVRHVARGVVAAVDIFAEIGRGDAVSLERVQLRDDVEMRDSAQHDLAAPAVDETHAPSDVRSCTHTHWRRTMQRIGRAVARRLARLCEQRTRGAVGPLRAWRRTARSRPSVRCSQCCSPR